MLRDGRVGARVAARPVRPEQDQIPLLFVPGDQLRIEMKVLKKKSSVAKMQGQATVDGVVVAEVEVLCKLADRDAGAPR